ncbi:hypothetical protein GYH30_008438 [Glycine max]|uniref:Uncharacterized protein n=1 Tax=Glycine max TaxID=3847 RepID=K7KH82_SOYBN|nr:hypothetical protein GYH30_008438 [Glycine max]
MHNIQNKCLPYYISATFLKTPLPQHSHVTEITNLPQNTDHSFFLLSYTLNPLVIFGPATTSKGPPSSGPTTASNTFELTKPKRSSQNINFQESHLHF